MFLFDIMVLFLDNRLTDLGIVPQVNSVDQASSVITKSALVSSNSHESRSETLAKQKVLKPRENKSPSKKVYQFFHRSPLHHFVDPHGISIFKCFSSYIYIYTFSQYIYIYSFRVEPSLGLYYLSG